MFKPNRPRKVKCSSCLAQPAGTQASIASTHTLHLLDLPVELLMMIADYLRRKTDRAKLLQLSRASNALFGSFPEEVFMQECRGRANFLFSPFDISADFRWLVSGGRIEIVFAEPPSPHSELLLRVSDSRAIASAAWSGSDRSGYHHRLVSAWQDGYAETYMYIEGVQRVTSNESNHLLRWVSVRWSTCRPRPIVRNETDEAGPDDPSLDDPAADGPAPNDPSP
ncbi:hypothetical protein BZA05DRAFT_449352 [Tricharina praecox]|uniref:uncharacterized protein n=1 Tax=Tricharina praecox TaxID=43433 RepID=UPI00221EF3A7|nr:uncharacterized protein BZA05DRAFT_449352 [Tricharina praecox]KAI5841992.1 hypothetical protein BZA05DRAFT_449352 [Tricharina praecox]